MEKQQQQYKAAHQELWKNNNPFQTWRFETKLLKHPAAVAIGLTVNRAKAI